MKILLVNAPPLKKMGIVGQIYPPLGIIYLSSYVKSKTSNFEFKAIDGYQSSISDTLKEIVSYSPDVLCVSMTTQGASGGYEIINEVKRKHPNILVITGGAHPTIMPEESLLKADADIAVVGEGEETFYELLSRINNNQNYNDVHGAVVRVKGEVQKNPNRKYITNIDEIPFPDRSLLDIRKYPGYHYKIKEWDTSYISGRGCPYVCTYCSNPVWKVQKPYLRLRSAENIIEEVEMLKSVYGVNEFYDQTDLFNGSVKWAKGVCRKFIENKVNIYWKVQMTVRNVDDELASLMSQAGCWLSFLGIETANDETLKGINKRSDRLTAEKTLTKLKEHGIKTFALLMAFNVWEEKGVLKFEDKEKTMQTFKFAEEMINKKKVDIISWSLTTPYPGSPLWDIVMRHNLIPENLLGHWENWDSSENFIMKLPGVNEKDWKKVFLFGKWLQIKLLFKSGTFNWRSLKIYFKKGFGVLRRAFESS